MAENVGASSSNDDGIKEQDRLLPIANVGRIMKQILPPNAKISKEAKETMQECVSEFISFVTSEASEKCRKERRKTVNGDDICWALATLGFDDYAVPLRRYLHKYRELEGDKAANQDKVSNSNQDKEEDQPSSSYGRNNQTRNQGLGPSPLKFSNNNSNLGGPYN
ncbi:Transcription factor, CBFA/NFYB, DNA topoisomerase [Corchorus capsularis]|uniref:Transcription factor, CBFA/NFYB, DNA topoisomerase n=1 Tax=Corchorus capsularis TaxID=210143 RepID=A0A1R3G6H5_COCAP|nr:Transcription factor, CBFA/NFYB, DNA topoisomerase [Corchorus capsularis]